METFVPGLKDAVLGLTETLRFVLYFICVAGLILQVHRARAEVESLTQPIVRAILVVGLIGTLPHWFAFTEKTFLTLANVVHERYTEQTMRSAALLRDSVAENPSDFSLRRVGESLYRASLWAAAKLIVLIASRLQLPFLVLQYLLKLLCYLFLPVALALMLVPSLSSLGARYVQQTLAVLSWPIGFAVTELVSYHLLTAYSTNLAAAYGLVPGEIDAASFASLLGGLLAALWLILGTLGTPFLMQMLFCSGAPLSGGGAQGLQQLFAIQHLALMIKSIKTGGAAAPALVAKNASNGGSGGPPPPPPPASPAPAPSAGPRRPDPIGDIRAAAALAHARLPMPQTTI